MSNTKQQAYALQKQATEWLAEHSVSLKTREANSKVIKATIHTILQSD